MRRYFSPTLSTLAQAIKASFLATLPGLDIKTLTHYPPISEATIKGYLNAKKRNLRSTKRTYTTPHHLFNTIQFKPFRINNVYASCFEIKGKVLTDQTGPFLLPSSSGNPLRIHPL